MPFPLLSLLVPALGAPAAGLGYAFARRRRASEARRWGERRRQEQDDRREALSAATGGRLRLCEPEEIQAGLTGERVWSLPLLGPEDISRFRQGLREIAGRRGFPPDRLDDLCSCVSEAAGGALGRGQGGVAQVWASDEGFSVLVTDCGRGIAPEALLGLTDGPEGVFFGAGQGREPLAFQLLLALSDTVSLSTGEEGTQILLHIRSRAPGGAGGADWIHAA